MYSIPADSHTVQKDATLAIRLLKEFSWLIEAYVLDFFTDSHWNKLPKSWQAVLDRVELGFLSNWLDQKNDCQYSEVWPLGLQALRAAAFAHSLPRQSVQSASFVAEFLRKNNLDSNCKAKKDDTQWKPPSEELSKAGGQHCQLDHLCRRHVKPKKQHEIARLAQVVQMVASSLDVPLILDVGSGQGHLSRLLSFGYGMRVVTIEGKAEHVAGAQKLDLQAIKDIYKAQNKQEQRQSDGATIVASQNSENNCHVPRHHQLFMSESSSKDDILKIIEDSEGSHPTQFGIVGLHTCGNLACTILRLFTSSPDALAVFNISCCYMKLTCGRKSDGYPMSNFVSRIPGHELSYEAKEVACHAIEMYQVKVRENSLSLKIHCFRATLETLITKYYPTCKRLGLRSVKHAEKMTFPEYAKKALDRVQLNIPENEFISSHIDQCLRQWKRVIAFYSLRLLLAPVIESVILLDRLLYLTENGASACLAPIFDPSLSPRNYVLVGVKTKR